MSNELQLQNHKLELIQWLSFLSDPKTIERLISIKQEVQPDFWVELSEAEKQSIERGYKVLWTDRALNELAEVEAYIIEH